MTHRDQFKKNGYCVIDAFDRGSILELQKVLFAIVQFYLKKIGLVGSEEKLFSLDELDKGLQFLRKHSSECISKIQRTISRTPEFFRLSSSSVLSSTIRDLFSLSNDEPLYMLSNGIIFGFPHDETKKSINFVIDWHKDTFFTIPRNQFIQIWVPLLQDACSENGALQVCPKSHKEGIGKQEFNAGSTFNYRYTVPQEEVDRYEVSSVDVKLGQALIFDGQLIHASGHNSSEQVRATMLGIFHEMGEHFEPLQTQYLYVGETPEEYFYNTFGDENIKSLFNESSAKKGEPVGGV